ncbi:MAG: nitrate reductase cytochrome c-type subunit [Pseudomonadota bacterium]
MKTSTQLIVLLAAVFTFSLSLADEIATLRHGTPINEEANPAPMPAVIDGDLRPNRSYPMQPPVIPHDVRGYEISLQVNRCMACHGRSRIEDSQAPMVSVTHYMDRDLNFLAEISPRRYFCDQCNVVQTNTRNVTGNSFRDMDVILEERAASERGD